MAKTTNKDVNTEIDPEIKQLQDKTAKGAVNLVSGILENPEVQKTIKNALVRETVKQAVIMSCLFIGILNLYGVAKQVIGFGWQVEAVISLVLMSIGLSYILKNMVTGKEDKV